MPAGEPCTESLAWVVKGSSRTRSTSAALGDVSGRAAVYQSCISSQGIFPCWGNFGYTQPWRFDSRYPLSTDSQS